MQAVEDETDPVSGLPFSVVTDPDNEYAFVTSLPTVNHAAHTLAADQDAYYAKFDTDKEHPVNRAGHMWAVHLRKKPD